MSSSPQAGAPPYHYPEVARAMPVPGSLRYTQEHIVQLALDTVAGCDFAALVVPEGEGLSVVASTDAFLGMARVCEHAEGWGPTRQALADGVCELPDIDAAEQRWPGLAAWAREYRISSLCAHRLATDRQVLGVLVVYSVDAGAFRQAQDLATYASHAGLAWNAVKVESELVEAVTTRQEIGKAVGVLMERHRVTEQAAFAMLTQASNNRNLKVRDLAAQTVTTGADPANVDVPAGERQNGPEGEPSRVETDEADPRVLRLGGDLDATTTDGLRLLLGQTPTRVGPEVHVDARHVGKVAVAPVRVLVETARTVFGRGGRLVLHDPPPGMEAVVTVLSGAAGLPPEALTCTHDEEARPDSQAADRAPASRSGQRTA